MYYLLINFITSNYDFFLLIINVALSLFSTALLLLAAVSGNSAAVLLRELDSAAAGLLRELEIGADS